MAVTLSAIDLSALPAPQVVQQIDFETVLAAMLADLQARDPTFTALLESDPAYKILEVVAYRETLLRQQMNDASVGLMLAYAEGGDLDQIGVNYGVTRLTITPANNTTIPPTAAVMETDSAFRARIQLSLEGYSSAGPSGAYLYFAKSASGDVLDASVTSPQPGTVLVTVLSQTGTGGAPQATLDAVSAALNSTSVRPLCDTVQVQSASIVSYSIVATLTLASTADQATVLANAQAAAQAYATARHKVGLPVYVVGVISALMVTGVVDAVLAAPGITTDLAITDLQASYCTGITLTFGGYGV
ncbi:baseplate J/gp47 family protein [Acidocella sp. MX-AZ03]|uniref:baseplate assembly protein n=1 Tax=Acidocella sp. MX-AZ03 TaxID=2697363 RepID=UPI0022DDA151|nr:baseplate J/gp47 family protein [Acidocella sp. MX-AZ03]WBO60542.1 baseplate J/gp47 family protein [Acidocella sp. MX-AZ03]